MKHHAGRLVGSAPDMDDRPYGQPDRSGQTGQHGLQGADSVWTIISLLVAGPVAWAGIGWLVDRLLGTSVGVPVGVVIGFVGALYLVYARFGRT